VIPTIHAKVHQHSDECECEFCLGGFVQYTCPNCGDRRLLAVPPGEPVNFLFCRCETAIQTLTDLLESNG
jgi:hypothetical protein